jgi:hypothetical protein
MTCRLAITVRTLAGDAWILAKDETALQTQPRTEATSLRLPDLKFPIVVGWASRD